METQIFKQTYKQMEIMSKSIDTVLVSFSGGRDSLVVLDLCRRFFKNVVCFYMFIVPELRCIEEYFGYAKQHWNVTILQYPHWVLTNYLKNGVYCDPHKEYDKIKDIGYMDIYRLAMSETGINYIATGMKKADSLWRRQKIGLIPDYVFHPLIDWKHHDVDFYIKINNIKTPDQYNTHSAGIDLSSKNILWLYKNYPDDYQKLISVFPYAESIVYRSKFYNEESNSKSKETIKKRRSNNKKA